MTEDSKSPNIMYGQTMQTCRLNIMKQHNTLVVCETDEMSQAAIVHYHTTAESSLQGLTWRNTYELLYSPGRVSLDS